MHTVKSRKVAIIGCGGFGREVLWLIRDHNDAVKLRKNRSTEVFDVVGFVDNDAAMHGKTLCDVPVLGSEDWLLTNAEVHAICGIGAPRVRMKITRRLEEGGVKFVTAIHPSVRMSDYVEIGTGCVVCAGTIITTQVRIGNHVHVNLNSTIGHDVVIDDYVTISPGANISGRVEIGYGADLGTNCSVIQNLKIGRGAIIGAGAVVNRDVEENVVSVGVPSRAIKKVAEPL
jgi:sugar O-acyltransferase (sialic acid O-acetyltransferase NeuD family)